MGSLLIVWGGRRRVIPFSGLRCPGIWLQARTRKEGEGKRAEGSKREARERALKRGAGRDFFPFSKESSGGGGSSHFFLSPLFLPPPLLVGFPPPARTSRETRRMQRDPRVGSKGGGGRLGLARGGSRVPSPLLPSERGGREERVCEAESRLSCNSRGEREEEAGGSSLGAGGASIEAHSLCVSWPRKR